MPKSTRTTLAIGTAALGAAAGVGLLVANQDPAPPASTSITLTDRVKALQQAPESPEGYKRSSFRHWTDEDADGCNTRSEVLADEADPGPPKEYSADQTCAPKTGEWTSAYDGKVITRARDLDIDHFVPLKEAWRSGAREWTADRREAYANDLTHEDALIAVSASSNRSKSDRDPASWLPPDEGYRCQYIVTWVHVKEVWELSVDADEREALLREAASCT